ncbi:Eukaryotic translation initiation factor 3 110 kDa subunit [Nocardioides sp. AX2bis]|nr:Eukaryotic translation initiation factor 3 110 kDa subunit [Nocardioides sp. AX2bis]
MGRRTPDHHERNRRADHRPRGRDLRADRDRERDRADRLLGVLVRPLPPVRAGLRAGLAGPPRDRLRQGRHRGAA